MKKGFTLLELIIVVIIIGILATIGFAQYTKVIEKGRKAEALFILGEIRTAEASYYLEHNAYTSTLGDLSLENIAWGACNTSYYFSYASTGGVGTATRCNGANGRNPGAVGSAASCTVIMDMDGTISGSCL